MNCKKKEAEEKRHEELNGKKADEKLAKAKVFFDQKDYLSVINILENFFDENPEKTEALLLYVRALTLYANNSILSQKIYFFQKALAEIQKLMRLQPSHSDAVNIENNLTIKLRKACLQQQLEKYRSMIYTGDYQNAMENLRSFIDENPDNTSALYLQAVAFKKRAEDESEISKKISVLKESLELLKQVKTLNPESSAAYSLSNEVDSILNEVMLQQQADQENEYVSKQLREIRDLLSRINDSDDKSKKISILQEAEKKLDKINIKFNERLRSELSELIEYIKNQLKEVGPMQSSGENDDPLQKGILLIEGKKFREASQYFRSILSKYPDNVELLYRYAQSLFLYSREETVSQQQKTIMLEKAKENASKATELDFLHEEAFTLLELINDARKVSSTQSASSSDTSTIALMNQIAIGKDVDGDIVVEDVVILEALHNAVQQRAAEHPFAPKLNVCLKKLPLEGLNACQHLEKIIGSGTLGGLQIQGSQMDSRVAAVLARLLPKSTTITAFRASNLNFDEENRTRFLNNMNENYLMQEIFVSGQSWTENEIARLAEIAARNKKGNAIVSQANALSSGKNCDLDLAIDDAESLQFIYNAFQQRKLKYKSSAQIKVKFKKLNLDNKKTQVALEGIINSGMIKDLVLEGTTFNDKAVNSLAKIIGINNTLCSLNIDNMNAGSKARKKFITALEKNKTVERIGITGVGWTPDELSKMKSMAQKNLDRNNLTRKKISEGDDEHDIEPSNISDKNGDTPLHVAIRKRNKKRVDDLLRNNALIHITNKAGKSPKDLAEELKPVDDEINFSINRALEERDAFDEFTQQLGDLRLVVNREGEEGIESVKDSGSKSKHEAQKKQKEKEKTQLKFLITYARGDEDNLNQKMLSHWINYELMRHLMIAGAKVCVYEIPLTKNNISDKEKDNIKVLVEKIDIFVVVGTRQLYSNTAVGCPLALEMLSQIESELRNKRKSLFPVIWEGQKDNAFPRTPVRQFSEICQKQGDISRLASYASSLIYDFRDLSSYYKVLVGSEKHDGFLHVISGSQKHQSALEIYRGLFRVFNFRQQQLSENIQSVKKIEDKKGMFLQPQHVIDSALKNFLSSVLQLERLSEWGKLDFGICSRVMRFLSDRFKGETSFVTNAGFISYAWEPDDAENKKLQTWLKQLKSDLAAVGNDVFLDVFGMAGNMSKVMKKNIADRNFFLIIGTPYSKVRAHSPVIPKYVEPVLPARRHVSGATILDKPVASYLAMRNSQQSQSDQLNHCLITYSAPSLIEMNYQICKDNGEKITDAKKIYVKFVENSLKYRILDQAGKTVAESIPLADLPTQINDTENLDVELLNLVKKDILLLMAEKKHVKRFLAKYDQLESWLERLSNELKKLSFKSVMIESLDPVVYRKQVSDCDFSLLVCTSDFKKAVESKNSPEYKFELLKDQKDFKIEPGKFYLKLCNNSLDYVVISPKGEKKSGSIPSSSLPSALFEHPDDFGKVNYFRSNILLFTTKLGHTGISAFSDGNLAFLASNRKNSKGKSVMMLPLLYEGSVIQSFPKFCYDNNSQKILLPLEISAKPNNFQYELSKIYKKSKKQQDTTAIYPLCYSGGFGTSIFDYTYDKRGQVIPFSLPENLIYWFNWQPYAQLLADIENPRGLLSEVLQISANGNDARARLYIALMTGFMQSLYNKYIIAKKNEVSSTNQSHKSSSYDPRFYGSSSGTGAQNNNRGSFSAKTTGSFKV